MPLAGHIEMRAKRAFLSPRLRTLRGVGLIEILVGLAIVGVLLGVAMPSLADLLEKRRVVAVALELSGILNFAKSEANVNGDAVTVHLDQDPDQKISCAMVNVTIGSDIQCKCYRSVQNMCGSVFHVAILRVFQINNSEGVSFEASATNWGAVPNSLGFTRNTYNLGVTGVKIAVTGRRTNAKLRVELSEVNRVRTCSPDGSITGFPVCS